jgi:hypothetical protein
LYSEYQRFFPTVIQPPYSHGDILRDRPLHAFYGEKEAAKSHSWSAADQPILASGVQILVPSSSAGDEEEAVFVAKDGTLLLTTDDPDTVALIRALEGCEKQSPAPSVATLATTLQWGLSDLVSALDQLDETGVIAARTTARG